MANTRQIPFQERPEEQLLEDLCIELRHVGVGDYGLPNEARLVEHIHEVNAIHAELARRGVDERSRLELLSKETAWQIHELLEDCLAFPKKMPYVREQDGIRRTLRCRACGKAERPPGAKVFWFCDACMGRVVDAIRSRVPCAGVILMRTYTPACRCPHADGDTVLATDGNNDFPLYGVCEKCILEEIERRKTLSGC
jgi:hypothetical protein